MAESITEERAAITLETSDHRKGNTVTVNTVGEDGWQQTAESFSLSAAPQVWSLVGLMLICYLVNQLFYLWAINLSPASSPLCGVLSSSDSEQPPTDVLLPVCIPLISTTTLSCPSLSQRSTCCSTLIWTEIFCVTSIKKLVKWAFIKCSIRINQINLVESTSNSSFCTLDYKLLILLFIKHNNFKLYSCFFITKLRSGQKHGRKCLIKFVPSQIPTPHFLSLCFLFCFLCVAFTSV